MPLELLSRIQFGFTIAFHILYPAFSIGLITFIAIFESIWLKTRNPHYLFICKFWTKILALTFGMGIVSGIVMEFQLGTNWSNFTNMAGNVLGVLFTYEVLTAFFIEAGFLGVMFFGWNKVSPELHFVATILALFGVTISAFWILSANSWMQTPGGVSFINGKFDVTNWYDVIFNPLFLPRYFHMLIATYIASLLVILAVCAYYLLKHKFVTFAKTCFSSALIMLLALIPLQLIVGDTVGLYIHKYQPLKTAAMEGIWETQRGAPLLLFAIPDQYRETNLLPIGIPKLAAYINTHNLNGELIGLKSVPPNDRPNMGLVFFSFRIMVGLWVIMLLTVLTGCLLHHKKSIFKSKWYLKTCILLSPIGFISILTGWFTAEFGRQPWVIYNILKTSAAASKTVTPEKIFISLTSIVLVYGIIFGYFYFRYFFKLIKVGPTELSTSGDETFLYLSQTINEPDPKK